MDKQANAILVTGGASGIGQALVRGLLRCGWKVQVPDLPGPRLD